MEDHPASPSNRIYDALIVGAGPAGSACAARLVEAGWSVAVVDRSAPGRPRVCGGFLGPEFETWVDAWGWGGDLNRLAKSAVAQVQVSGSGSRLVRTGLAHNGYAVDRGVFDRWVADVAVSRGALLWTDVSIEDSSRIGGIWTARVRSNDGRASREVLARHWINATGRRPAASGKKNSFFACKAVYRGVRGPADAVALHFVERGHIGLNPLSPEEATLCLCVDGRYLREAHGDLDAMMQRFLSANHNLKAQLEGAHRVSEWKTCQAEPDDHPIFFQDEKFFVGDALSMVNPVIGGGIPIAMQSGVLLADLMARGKSAGRTEPETAVLFERAWRKAFTQKYAYGRWLGRAERSTAASRLVMGAINAAPLLLSPLVRMSRPVPSSHE